MYICSRTPGYFTVRTKTIRQDNRWDAGMMRAVLGILLIVASAGVVSAETLTLFTTNSSDGYIGMVGTNLTFTDIRNGDGTNRDIQNPFSTVRLVQDNETDRYGENWRPAFIFNGSAIPDDALIQDASLGIHINFIYDDLGEQAFGNYSLVKFNIDGPINADDYDNFDWVRLADDRNTALITTGHYTNWSLNSAGLSNISKIGDFGFGFKGYYDMENAPPSWVNGSDKMWIGFGFSAADSVMYPPFIEITYTLPDSAPPAGITGLGDVATCNSITWTWTNPADADFSHTYILQENVFDINATGTTTLRLWKNLAESTTYTFSSKTVDMNGNMNATWVNQSATTGACGISSKIGVVRNGNTWLLDASGNGMNGAGDLSYVFGKAGDVYVTGDWNTDGKTEIGVVRNGNTWLLDASGNGAYGAGDLSYVFGKAGDKYVTGKW